ncbi:hemerythrin domain-containing protein [Brachyspira murdochii]|uniref:hemerythrin domain-containing protein n=1 Tax=Brachyspira murdochii TaxID=84378 RepID=UPI003006DC51
MRDAIDNCNITNNYNIINIFKKENRYIEKLLNDISSVNILYKELSRHYYKKESILFKALKSYGNDEPSKVMTRVDKDILESLKYIIDSNLNSDDLKEKYEEINASILDMIFKEENILIPLCIDTLSKEDFEDIESKYSKNS